MNERTELAIREYEALNLKEQQLHKTYYNLLKFIVIIIGALAVGIFSLDVLNNKYACHSMLMTLLFIAGYYSAWAYCALELWNVRRYLAKIEDHIRSNYSRDDEKPFFFLYSSGMFTMYTSEILGIHCDKFLKVVIVIPIFSIYLFTALLCYDRISSLEKTTDITYGIFFTVISVTAIAIIMVTISTNRIANRQNSYVETLDGDGKKSNK